VAYHKYGRVYYRSLCTACINKKKKIKPPVPRWQSAGYKKKPACDRCGFKSRYSAQLLVFHIDGDLQNTDNRNLKTICLNCAEEIKRSNVTWTRGDLEPDL
jgi:hypothetical protein